MVGKYPGICAERIRICLSEVFWQTQAVTFFMDPVYGLSFFRAQGIQDKFYFGAKRHVFSKGGASSVGTDSRSSVFLKKHKQLQRRV